jgi:hypothetical protein
MCQHAIGKAQKSTWHRAAMTTVFSTNAPALLKGGRKGSNDTTSRIQMPANWHHLYVLQDNSIGVGIN